MANSSIESLQQLALTLEDALERARKLASQYETTRIVVRDDAREAPQGQPRPRRARTTRRRR